MTADDRLAAELAIGLLDGEALLGARARTVSDPEFRIAVEEWERRLAPLLDTMRPEAPPSDIWARIEAAITEAPENAEVIALHRRIRFWQRAAGGAAIAACAAIAAFVIQPQLQQAPAGSSGAQDAPLVASIPIGDTPLRLGVTYLPERRELLVSASGLTADGVHDHELWLVPDSGTPLSLGVVAAGAERRVPIDPDIARLIHDGSGMVLTREPLGGKPASAEAGPVVAQGSFVRT